MKGDVLVAYATAHGSTAEIAARVAAAIPGATVREMSAEPPGDHAGYVLGSAVHNGAWLPAARAYLAANERLLAGRHVWTFSVGMPGALRGPLARWAMAEEPRIAGMFPPALNPRAHRLFTGVIRREHLPPFGRLVFRLLGGRYGDFRDWAAVESWGKSIAAELSGAER